MIDSHCHFDFDVFDSSRSASWERCRELGVSVLLIPGVDIVQWKKVRALSEEYSGIVFAAGLHPWWIDDAQHRSVSGRHLRTELMSILSHPKCVGVGESGLDALKGPELPVQIQWLRVHIELSIEYAMPLILHCVKAHNELLRLLDEYRDARGVIHAFSGSKELALDYWKRGFYLGAGGALTYERASKTRKAFACLPDEAILLETDAPDMPLCGRQGEKNSPEHLPEIAAALADLRGQSVRDIGRVTTRNFYQLFSKASKGV